jgi:hypothetical protein
MFRQGLTFQIWVKNGLEASHAPVWRPWPLDAWLVSARQHSISCHASASVAAWA